MCVEINFWSDKLYPSQFNDSWYFPVINEQQTAASMHLSSSSEYMWEKK